jgi:hypothetical protein
VTTGVIEIIIRCQCLIFDLFFISFLIANLNVNFDKGKGGERI